MPRDLPVPGRELDGVHFAMEYLAERARVIAGTAEATISAAGKHVVVIGGGDTGADCVGHAHREGAASVTQIELLGEPPPARSDDLTPWPLWPMKLRTSYALKEGGERDFSISTTRFEGQDGAVERIVWQQNTGVAAVRARRRHRGVAARRSSCCSRWASSARRPQLLDALGVERDAAGQRRAPRPSRRSVPGVFAAGDARRGQSLIVWAIDEGRRCANAVREWLDARDSPAHDVPFAFDSCGPRSGVDCGP